MRCLFTIYQRPRIFYSSIIQRWNPQSNPSGASPEGSCKEFNQKTKLNVSKSYSGLLEDEFFFIIYDLDPRKETFLRKKDISILFNTILNGKYIDDSVKMTELNHVLWINGVSKWLCNHKREMNLLPSFTHTPISLLTAVL